MHTFILVLLLCAPFSFSSFFLFKKCLFVVFSPINTTMWAVSHNSNVSREVIFYLGRLSELKGADLGSAWLCCYLMISCVFPLLSLSGGVGGVKPLYICFPLKATMWGMLGIWLIPECPGAAPGAPHSSRSGKKRGHLKTDTTGRPPRRNTILRLEKHNKSSSVLHATSLIHLRTINKQKTKLPWGVKNNRKRLGPRESLGPRCLKVMSSSLTHCVKKSWKTSLHWSMHLYRDLDVGYKIISIAKCLKRLHWDPLLTSWGGTSRSR